jgi:hypothetical protein
MMHIEGRARKPSFRKGFKLLQQAAKAGYTPAAENDFNLEAALAAALEWSERHQVGTIQVQKTP